MSSKKVAPNPKYGTGRENRSIEWPWDINGKGKTMDRSPGQSLFGPIQT